MFNFDQLASAIARQTVLCVGDLMLDEFVYGEVSRISPEAPAPVIAVNHTDIMIGGAGNMVRNIASLGARCIFVALIGRDEAAHVITSKLSREPSIEPLLVVDPSRPTTRKMRFVSEHFSTHLLRADWEFAHAAPADIEQELIDKTLAGDAARQRRGAVRLRQGRADAARDPRGDRCCEQGRQAGDRRSEEPGSVGLSRRHHRHAESQGARRGDTPACRRATPRSPMPASRRSAVRR